MIYPEKLGSFLKKYPAYIPYRIKDNKEYLKEFRRYWLEDSAEIIKVLEKFEANDIEYYIVKIGIGFHGVLPYPVKGIQFELVPDKKNLFKNTWIFDDGKLYSGAEIKFWFFVHPKDCKIMNPYNYIDLQSDNIIDDDTFYIATYINENLKIIPARE